MKPDGLEAALVRMGIERRCTVCITKETEAEYREVLLRPKFLPFREAGERILADVAAAAIRVEPAQAVTAALDEDDNRFLECAQAARAHFLITGNLRDYPEEWLGTRILNARAFFGQHMLTAPNLAGLKWLRHGFGFRDSVYPDGIVTARQIHSDIVAEADDGIDEADALVTAQPGTIVGIRTADCVPVLIADNNTHAVAAVHAGWRGSAVGIVRKAVEALLTRYGAKAENLHAAVGPAIGPCCYEVSADVARQFGDERATHLNLWQVNERQLREAGVRDIWVAEECTRCDPARYFSYRREKEQAGRMVSFIGARDGAAELKQQ